MLNLNWIKCDEDRQWCPLESVNLSGVTANGVYIIWHDGRPSRVVRVGQGDIAARLKEHRDDPKILTYNKQGTLRVTWATVSAAQRDGVERYLADRWAPLIGDVFPDAEPLAVNAPW